MLSVLFASQRMLRICFSLALVWFSSSMVWAVPPTKDDGNKKDDAHPADGRVAEKIAGASAEGQQAMSAFKKPEGWQVSLFAAEPELANPVCIFVDHLARVFVCESFRQGVGVTDNRGHDQEWLHADLAAQSVDDRIAYHRKLLGEKAE